MTVSRRLRGDWSHAPTRKAPDLTVVGPERGDGSKLDTGKVGGFHLLPPQRIKELAALYEMGATKYVPRGWEQGMSWSRIYNALNRHMLAWLSGEQYDPKDGQHHLTAVAWCAFALRQYEETHPELDDIHPQQEVAA